MIDNCPHRLVRIERKRLSSNVSFKNTCQEKGRQNVSSGFWITGILTAGPGWVNPKKLPLATVLGRGREKVSRGTSCLTPLELRAFFASRKLLGKKLKK